MTSVPVEFVVRFQGRSGEGDLVGGPKCDVEITIAATEVRAS